MTEVKPTNDLAKILENVGKFSTKTKKEAEFVVTRYNENLEWTRGLEHLVTVYNKGSTDFSIEGTQIHHVPNFGVGIESMLRHIISNYENLADITMFCQATLADRQDQPMYPLDWYFESDILQKGVKGVMTDSYDVPRSRMRFRISNDGCKAIKDRTLVVFREKVVGVPYKYLVEFWVRGDWISVTKETIRKKPHDYYMYLYSECQFGRGVLVEECWFMERTFVSLFTRQLRVDFPYKVEKDKEVLLI